MFFLQSSRNTIEKMRTPQPCFGQRTRWRLRPQRSGATLSDAGKTAVYFDIAQTLRAPPQEMGLTAQRASGMGGREAAPPPPYGTSGGRTKLKPEWGGLRPLGSHFHATSLHLSPPFLSFLPPLSSPKQLEIVCKADLLKNEELNYHMTQPSHCGA